MLRQITNIHSIIWFLFVAINPLFNAAGSTDTSNRDMELVENISVYMTNSTSVVLSWKIEFNFTEDLRSLSVWYRPRGRVDQDEPRLKYDPINLWYTAQYGVDVTEYAWQTVVSTKFYEEPEISLPNEMLIFITNLFANMEYDFIIHRIPWTTDFGKRTAKIVAMTKPAALKSGAGCFRVVDVGFATRKVQFFWRGFSETGEYEIEIREEGPCFNKQPELIERGQIVRGVKEVTISKKRHWFIIRRYGHPDVEESVVDIPHQGDILDEPSNMVVRLNQAESLYSLTWTKPADVNVANYTIFWMGIRRREGRLVKAIMDLVHVPGDRTSFAVKSEEKVILFLAMNTDSSSSGLRMIEHHFGNEQDVLAYND